MEKCNQLIQRGVSQASKTTVQAKGQERKMKEASLLKISGRACHQLADNERWFPDGMQWGFNRCPYLSK